MKGLSIDVVIAAILALLAGITKGGGDLLGLAADPPLLSIGAVGLGLALTTDTARGALVIRNPDALRELIGCA